MNYSEQTTPKTYKCANCNATNVKLWREYNTFNPELLCANCAAKDQNKDISNIDENGMRTSESGKTDQIGWYIPAVPTEDETGYWGYTSVPDNGVEWWTRLQTGRK